MTVVQLDQQRTAQALLAYSKRGWHLFPCHQILESGSCSCGDTKCGSPGKHPRVGTGFKVATTDMEQIGKWLKRWPDCNWAVACGASRLAVVDVDPRNQGDATLADLERANGSLPRTVTALTGGGGQHYIYRWPNNVDNVRSAVLGHGIELKAEGGYIIVAPSNHLSGKRYGWDAGAHPNDEDPSDTPNWIIKLAGDRKRGEKYEIGGAVTDGFLGACFDLLGWLGRSLGPDKAAARCPNEAQHTHTNRFDSSTVVFAPRKGARVGWFHCSHAHCAALDLKAVLAEIPDDIKRKAREQLSLDPAYDPEQDRQRETELTPAPNNDVTWQRHLRFNDQGRLTRDAGNASLLLANLDAWAGCLEYDEFADRFRWVRPVPTMDGLAGPRPGDDLTDFHVTYVHHWLAKYRGVSFAKQSIQDALESAAHANPVHPVRAYLAALQWDGVPRATRWLERYLGAPSDDYVAAMGRWWLISAVARVMVPGCQADHLLVLESAQGAGKSTAARILGGDWFLASLPDITNKDAASVLQGHWIAEIGELDAFRGAAATRIKNWISCRVDSYRPAYGRFTVRRERQCVFLGTTNESQYLTDTTGARRFWPATVTRLDRSGLTRDRDQIWAEAAHYYFAGETWHPQEEWVPALSEAQDERYTGDEWEQRIRDWISSGEREGFSIGEVLAGPLGLEVGKWDRASQTRAGHCLARLGYVSRRVSRDSGRVRAYFPSNQKSAGVPALTGGIN